MLFNRAKGDNKDVLFIDASQGYESGTNQNRLRDKDIDKIVNTYRAFQEANPLTTEEGEVLEDRFAYRATLKEVEENEYNLNIPRYVDTFEEEAEVDIPATQNNIIDLKKELATVEDQMDTYLKILGY
jgi:type I restriction enzyme M protein